MSSVNAHTGGFFVLVKVGLEREGLTTSATDVGFGVGVGLDVGA